MVAVCIKGGHCQTRRAFHCWLDRIFLRPNDRSSGIECALCQGRDRTSIVLELSVSCDSPDPSRYCRRSASFPSHPIKENLPGWSFAPYSGNICAPSCPGLPRRFTSRFRRARLVTGPAPGWRTVQCHPVGKGRPRPGGGASYREYIAYRRSSRC
jgi:hypothetical protein